MNAWANAACFESLTTAAGYVTGRYVSSAGRNASITWPARTAMSVV